MPRGSDWRERAADDAEAGVVDGVGGDDRRAQSGTQAMVARAIRHLGDEVDAIETLVKRRGEDDVEIRALPTSARVDLP